MALSMPFTPARRGGPLPPLDGPRGHQRAAVALASGQRSRGASAGSSRPSSGGSFALFDGPGQSSRSTSASLGGGCAGPGELLGSLASQGQQESPQAELVVKALLPIVKRAM